MFAVKLFLVIAAIWSALGLAARLYLAHRRRVLTETQKNLIGGPVFLALALRGWLADHTGVSPRLVDLSLGFCLLWFLTGLAFAR